MHIVVFKYNIILCNHELYNIYLVGNIIILRSVKSRNGKNVKVKLYNIYNA